MPKYSCEIAKLEQLSKEELVKQAGVVTCLLMNEAQARGNIFVISRVTDDPFYKKVLAFDETQCLPDKPLTLSLEDSNV